MRVTRRGARLQLALPAQAEVESTLFARLQAHDDELGWMRSEYLSHVSASINFIDSRCDRRVEIEFAPVFRYVTGMVEIKQEIAQRLVVLVERPLHLVALFISSVIVLVFEDQLSNTRQAFWSPRVIPVLRIS